MDRGAWRATVQGVMKSQAGLRTHALETVSVSVPEPYLQCLVPVCQEILFSSGSEACALSAVHNCPPAIHASGV